MKNAEKLKTIQLNIEDGLSTPFNPVDDDDAMTDLRIKLEIFDFALDGLKDKSSHSVIEHDDLINLAHFWLNIYINLEHVLPLLEYVEDALDPSKDVVELEDKEHYQFSVTRIKHAINRYRKSNKRLHEQLVKEGLR